MADDNPFTLTFGKHPNEYISRYESIDTIIQTFNSRNPMSQAFLLEGVRGSGKTVLMTIVEQELAKLGDWIVVDLNSTRKLLEAMAARLESECRNAADMLKSGFNLSVAGFGVGINGGEKKLDDVAVIEEILSSAKKKGKKVLVTIDEVMPGQDMRHFASQFQIFLRKDYPVFLLMTGLYENICAVQNDPALTFLLRTPKITLEPLSLFQIARQYP